MHQQYRQKIESKLEAFTAHGLNDLSRAVLMNRVDTKYLINKETLSSLLDELHSYCSVLEIDGHKISQYENTYYDCEQLQFYQDHHNGKLNRYKVRKRTYADFDLSYLEVKLKNNKSRTLKKRIKTSAQRQALSQEHSSFLNKNGIVDTNKLIEQQECNYSRIAFASEATAERLTVDMGLNFTDPQTSESVHLDNMIILELKQEKLNRSSKLFQLLKKYNLRPCSFSKYCIGISLLAPQNKLKRNRFKPAILHMNKVSGASFHE